MALPSWVDAPASWDIVTIAGEELPGLARVKAARKYRLDRKDQAGADGGSLTGLGHMPAEVEITLRIWETAHFDDLQKVLPKLVPKPGKGHPSPVDVAHPALALLGINSLYVTEVGSPEETGTKHLYEVTFRATEFLPVKKGNVTLTPKMSTSSDSVPVEPGLLSPADTESGP